MGLRFRKNAGSLRNVMKLKRFVKNIARVRTEQRRREIEQGLVRIL